MSLVALLGAALGSGAAWLLLRRRDGVAHRFAEAREEGAITLEPSDAPELLAALGIAELAVSLDARALPGRVGLFALHQLTAAELRRLDDRALEKLEPARALFARHAQSVLIALRGAGRPCADLCACMLAVQDALGLLRERQPAALLLPDAARLARELTAREVARLDERLAREGRLPGAARPLSPAAQADFAAGIALHDEAVEASHRKSPRAHALVLASLARLEAALGKDDPLLVPSLANAARALSLAKKPAAAEEALLRAHAMHVAVPGHDEGEALRLLRLLEHVRAEGETELPESPDFGRAP